MHKNLDDIGTWVNYNENVENFVEHTIYSFYYVYFNNSEIDNK